MTFDQAMETQPAWVQYWVMWMAIAIIGTFVVLLFSKATRRDAVVILLSMVAVYLSMMWLYEKVGFVRLLGIVHVVFWTPLAIYLWWRLKDQAITAPFRQAIWIFLATILISLAFDYADVARYILGERASMVPRS
jgi:hypothetical protein